MQVRSDIEGLMNKDANKGPTLVRYTIHIGYKMCWTTRACKRLLGDQRAPAPLKNVGRLVLTKRPQLHASVH